MPFKNNDRRFGKPPHNKGIYKHKSIPRKIYYRRLEIASSQFNKFNKMIESQKFYGILKRDDILNGLILSDAHLRKTTSKTNSQFILGQTERNKELVSKCQNHLDELGINSNIFHTIHKERVNLTVTLYSSKNISFSELRRYWYPNNIKIVPKDLKLTPKMIAWWFMGDGSSSWKNKQKDKTTVTFCTQGFDDESVILLQKQLIGLGLKYTRLERVKNIGYEIILSRSIDINNLFDMIEPYILKSFQYKIKRPRITSFGIANRSGKRRHEVSIQMKKRWGDKNSIQ